MPKKRTKSRLMDIAHGLWSRAVRQRDKYTCQLCGKKHPEKSHNCHAHHIFTRGPHSNLRFTLENGITLCGFGCHKYGRNSAHEAPYKFRDWLIEARGEEFWERLREAAYIPKKWTVEDLEIVIDVLEGVVNDH